jgi:uncharacterized protein YgiM (DUF1202 family)
MAVALVSCGESAAPTGVATNPPGAATGAGTSTASPSSAASGVRTVLSPLGINIRSNPAVTAAKLGTVAEGVELTVVDHTDQNGGWYKVQGQTVTGWISGDPALTAPGHFTQYQSTQRAFAALYRQDWTFAEEASDVLFHPVNGAQTIVERGGASIADFGPNGGQGFAGSGQETVVVCGVTGDLLEYRHGGAAQPTPAPGHAGPLEFLAQIRLRLDATHALALDFNYSAAVDLDVFREFYNSMTFPFPQCQQTPTPAPAPT